MRTASDLSLASLSQPVKTEREVIDRATENLEDMNQRGILPPLPDWKGDNLEGWMDLLGLNGRPIRLNHGPGLRG